MDDNDFLKSAEALALKNPDNKLSIAFLEAFSKEDFDQSLCITLASKLILGLESLAEWSRLNSSCCPAQGHGNITYFCYSHTLRRNSISFLCICFFRAWTSFWDALPPTFLRPFLLASTQTYWSSKLDSKNGIPVLQYTVTTQAKIFWTPRQPIY